MASLFAILASLLHMRSAAEKPKIDAFSLDNGLRVVVIHLAESKNVSIFSLLPMGLADDGPAQTQWSHLIEHLAIRCTIPSGLSQANAETLPDHMRLDFYGTVETWQEGLSHHARWVEGVPFAEPSLAAEKTQIKSECENVARRLATHKFAIAAWAQGVRHGRKHTAIIGDMERATLAEIQRYRDERLAVLNRTVVCVVGGINAATARPVVAEKLGRIQSKARLPDPVQLQPFGGEVTWDLDARHLLLTWPAPNVSDPNHAALLVAAPWLMGQFAKDAELRGMTGLTLAGADLFVPEGNFFYISASVRPEATFEAVRKRLDVHLQAMRAGKLGGAEVQRIASQIARSLTEINLPAASLFQTGRSQARAMIEANVGLQWAMQEFRYGKHREALAGRLKLISADDVCDAAEAILSDQKRIVCTQQSGEARPFLNTSAP